MPNLAQFQIVLLFSEKGITLPVEFPCQQCQKLLRVPDGTAGNLAKCPSCQAVNTIPFGPGIGSVTLPPLAPASSFGSPFAANVGTQNPYATPAMPAPQPYRGGSHEPQTLEQLRAFAKSKLFPAAILQIICGSVSLLGGLCGVGIFVFMLVAEPRLNQNGNDLLSVGFFSLLGVVNIALGGVTVLGGRAMLRLRSKSLVLAGCICALIPSQIIGGVCCCPVYFLNLTGGILGLMALNDPQVQSAFDTPPV